MAPVRTTARVGLLGCGVVGTSVARALPGLGDGIELARVAVLHPRRPRDVALSPGSLCGDAIDVVDDPTIDVIVEAIGGVDLPRSLIGRALSNGKSVVTANKEVLGVHGHELARAARDAGVDLLFEGAVGGAVPVVSVLRDRVASETVHRVWGIVNGTTNFVLGMMAGGRSQREAVVEAQRLGYAESDPAADLDGRDAAAKLAILASVAFGGWVTVDDVEREGIERIDRADIAGAAALGLCVKLVGDATPGRLSVRPALVARGSSLAGVAGVDNEVGFEGTLSQQLTFRGPGAGGDATAGAVVSDVVTATRNLRARTRLPLVTRVATRRPSIPRPERWFLRMPDGPSAVARFEGAGIAVEKHVCFPFGDEVHTAFVTAPAPPLQIDALGHPAVPILEV